MCNDTIAIKAQNISKKYILNQKTKDENGEETSEFWALKNVSFEIKKGESIGIIGPNGSGKSTLLKILAGITKPSAGNVTIRGRVASILEIGAGFHPELSGRDNIFLNGQLLGFSEKKIKKKYIEIVAFSGIEKFINEPVKNYSSGMYLRLAFSIMAILEFDVYLLDEVLSVGDEEFNQKCQQKIRELMQKKTKTFVIISHQYNDLKNICEKYFNIEKGVLRTHVTIDDYFENNFSKSNETILESKSIKKSTYQDRADLYQNVSFTFKDSKNAFKFDEIITIDIHFDAVKTDFYIGISVKDQFKNAVFECYFNHLISEETKLLTLELPNNFFNQGYYKIDFILFKKDTIIQFIPNTMSFNILKFNHPNTIEKRSWGPAKPYIKINSNQ